MVKSAQRDVQVASGPCLTAVVHLQCLENYFVRHELEWKSNEWQSDASKCLPVCGINQVFLRYPLGSMAATNLLNRVNGCKAIEALNLEFTRIVPFSHPEEHHSSQLL